MSNAAEPIYGSFKLSEWEYRRLFVSGIEASCKEQGVTVQWFSEYWIAKLTKGAKSFFISAYLFPLNDAAAARIATDKVATYQVLQTMGVPAVKHWLVRFPSDIAEEKIASSVSSDVALPLVLKPCDRGGGSDIYKVETQSELIETLLTMAARYRTIAASPFEEIIDEYRVVILDQAPVLVFRKVRPQAEWRHNLQFGAQPEQVTDLKLQKKLSELALRTTKELRLRFSAVDIITTKHMEMKVMEVNAGFSMSKVAGSPQFAPSVATVYNKAIAAMFS